MPESLSLLITGQQRTESLIDRRVRGLFNNIQPISVGV
jgi:hypothetical protein